MNAWDALGLQPGAPKTEVKRAFREKARAAHPDGGGSAEAFQQLRDAYKDALHQLATGQIQVPAAAGGAGFGAGYWDGNYAYGDGYGAPSGYAGSREPPPGWGTNMKDYFEEKREKVKREWEGWRKDANWQDNQQWRDRRQRQRDREQRRMREEEHRQRVMEARSGDRAQFHDALRDEAGRPRQRDSARPRARRMPRDLHKSDWAALDDPTPSAEATKAARSGSDAGPKYGPIVGHRTIAMVGGPVRVPLYLDSDGSQFYVSPRTSARVKVSTR